MLNVFIQTEFILSKLIYSGKITLLLSDSFISNFPLEGAFALFFIYFTDIFCQTITCLNQSLVAFFFLFFCDYKDISQRSCATDSLYSISSQIIKLFLYNLKAFNYRQVFKPENMSPKAIPLR